MPLALQHDADQQAPNDYSLEDWMAHQLLAELDESMAAFAQKSMDYHDSQRRRQKVSAMTLFMYWEDFHRLMTELEDRERLLLDVGYELVTQRELSVSARLRIIGILQLRHLPPPIKVQVNCLIGRFW